MFSCEFCEIFKNTFFHRTLPVAASKIRKTTLSLLFTYVWALSNCALTHSRPLQAAPTNSNQLQPTPIHSRPLQPTPGHSRLLQPTPGYYNTFQVTPTNFNPLQATPTNSSHFNLLHAVLTHCRPLHLLQTTLETQQHAIRNHSWLPNTLQKIFEFYLFIF